MTDRVPCSDIRCGRPRATEEDNERKCPSDCRHCAALCWFAFDAKQHAILPPWETWAPAAIRAAVEGERKACEEIALARAALMNRLGSDANDSRSWTNAEVQAQRVLEAQEIAAAIRGREEGAQ